MAQSTSDGAVIPLNTLAKSDLKAGRAKIDKWLRAKTSDNITLDRIETVARNIPVVGSVFAAVDVVSDVMEIYDKGVNNADFTDWVNLGIDAIAVIPAPATATVRSLARPALYLIKEETKKITKNGAKQLSKENIATAIKASVITLIASHLNSALAGEVQKFAESGQQKLNSLLVDTANWIGDAGNRIELGIKLVVIEGKIANPNANYDRAEIQRKAISTRWNEGDYWLAIKNAGYSIENMVKGDIKSDANRIVKAGMWVIKDEYKEKILQLGAGIKQLSLTGKTKIQGLGNPETAMSIGWLFAILLLASKKHKVDADKKAAQIKAQQAASAQKRQEQARLEKIKTQEAAKKDASQCKNCMGKTGGSITFAMGTEFFTHIDAEIGGMIQDSIIRTYASNLYQMDDSIFGARWITPFNTKISRKFKYDPKYPNKKEYKKGFEYIGVDGRPIDLPNLKKGQSIYDPVEMHTYTVLSDQLHLIAYGEDEKRFYEKNGEDYRLSYIERKHGFKVALRYDHVSADNNTLLSDIIFKQEDKILTHLGLQVNSQGFVSDIWTIKNGKLDRILASYDYDAQGDLIKATNEFAASYYYQYDHHLITRYTDLTNRGMNLKWDGILPSSKAIEEWADNASRAAKLEWDQNIRKTYVTDVEGNATEHFYDIDGYTYRIVYPDNFQEWFFRDDAKNITLHIAKDGSKTSYTYDERGNVLTTTQDNGATTYFSYDAKDQLIGMVDAEQGRWFKEYDEAGNLVKEIDPFKHETVYSYNGMGLVTSIKDAKGGSKALQYDEQGNLICYTDCSGKETKWQYDERGRVISVENALKQKVEYFYTELTTQKREPIIKGLPLNAFGQLEKIKHADGTEEHFIHDAEGRLLVHIDPKKQQTHYEYDDAGLILSRTDALNHKLRYQWDRLQRLTQLTNENGANYQFFYDLGGRLIKEIDFDGKETVYHYDESTGRLATSIEVAASYGQDLKDRAAPKDRIQQFIFDSMGRLEQRTAGYGHYGLELEEQQTEEFAYDYMGRLIQAKNKESDIQWFYDAVGNVIREHHHDLTLKKTAVWKHSYDEIYDRIKTIRPDGQVLNWLTYGSGHVHGLALNGEDLVSFERDDLHREIARHYANGISQEQQYDLAGRLNSQITFSDHENGYQKQAAKNNAIQQTQQLVKRLYHYDKTGELVGIKDTRRGNISYKYDPVGRLLEANSQIGKETFSFDPASNILDRDQDHHAQHHLNNKQDKGDGYNRLVNNVVKEYLDQQYQYDAYGQLIRQKSTQGDLNLEWDVFGRMIKSQNKVYTAEYRYDALGRRIQKVSKHHHTGDEQNTLYGWDGDTLAFESSEHATKHYIYEKDSFVPMLQAVYQSPIELHQTPDWSDKPYSVHRDPLWKTTKQSKGFDEVCFYHCDHLGTPQELSNHAGQIVWKAQYKAWGELVSDKTSKDKSSFFENSEILTNNIRFQGQYFDEETGLHYNRYRYYSPYVGRFVSKDPIGLLGGNNNYEYAPSPIRWIDVLGLQKKCYQTFYRGDSRSVTQMSKSHQANANGYQKATDLIKKGDNDKLMDDHQEDSRNPLSPFISVTTNPKVAEYFATNEGTTSGTVYELKVECGRARQNKFNKKAIYLNGKWVSEDEWLIPGYIRPSEIVGKKKV